MSATNKLNAPERFDVVVAVPAPPVTDMSAFASAVPVTVSGDEVAQNWPRVIVGTVMLIGEVVAVDVATGVTNTKNVVDAVLPESSVTVHVTVVVPIAKSEEPGGAHVTVSEGSRLSVTVGSGNGTIAPADDVAVAVTLVVVAKTGSVSS